MEMRLLDTQRHQAPRFNPDVDWVEDPPLPRWLPITAGGVLAIGVVWHTFFPSTGLVALGAAMLIGYVLARPWLERKANRDRQRLMQQGAQKALEQLDLISNGLHFVGRECEALALGRGTDINSCELLCRGNSGVLFVCRVHLYGRGSGITISANAIDTAAATKWLEPFPRTYRRLFGEPARA